MKRAQDTGRAWIEIRRDALRQNVVALRTLLPPRCELMPALKANAYGHGALPVARELNCLGVRAFCVATVGEGMELRQGGVEGLILVLGYTPPEDFALLPAWDLTQAAIDCEYAKMLAHFGRGVQTHLAIDTGMHRCGERWEQMDALCEVLRSKRLRATGAFTHLCAADSADPEAIAYTLAQARAFADAIRALEGCGWRCAKQHLLASYGLLNYPQLGGDYARVGIALYGLLSGRNDFVRHPLPLTPVLSLKARIALLKTLRDGEHAGYGLEYAAHGERTIAVLPIGYADGLPRDLSCGRGHVLLHGRKAPIVGRVCMDQTLVDVTDIPETRRGDAAAVIGRSGEQEIAAYDLSEAGNTITNEWLSRLGARLPRIVV